MYESFYGLTGKPFQLNPDPSFFFGSRGHKRAFAYLQYGLYQNEGFIVITGEIGAGKTTLVRSLFEQLDTHKVVAAQLVSTQLDADDLLRAVGVAFGLPVKTVDKAVLLMSIEAFLCKLALEKKRALLVVDEAQNLTPRAIEELRMLSNFQLGDQALLQSFLVGQPELRAMMQSPQMQQLRQRVIASYHLGPMDRGETEGYVVHRLRHVGWNENPRITTAAFDLIHGFTGGIPRRINTLCNRLMLAGFLAEKHVLDTGDVEAIAREMRDELGPGVTLGPVPEAKPQPMVEPAADAAAANDAAAASGSAHAAAAANAGTSSSQGSATSTVGSSAPDLAADMARAAALDRDTFEAGVRRIEDRIDRLDQTVGTAVDLLNDVVHPEREATPGTLAGR